MHVYRSLRLQAVQDPLSGRFKYNILFVTTISFIFLGFLSSPPRLSSLSSHYLPKMASEDPFVKGLEKPDPTSLMSNPGSVDIPRDQNSDGKDEQFALGRRGQLVFFTLAVLTLMAALDGTSLSVALPVILPDRSTQSTKGKANQYQDYCPSFEWYSD